MNFFDTDDLNYDEYDYKVSFEIIDKLYNMTKDYKELLARYNKYQRQIKNLPQEERDAIMSDPEFMEIQRKLDVIDNFTRLNAFEQI